MLLKKQKKYLIDELFKVLKRLHKVLRVIGYEK